MWKDRPRHDDASHGADAFLTFACSGYRPPRPYKHVGGLAWVVAIEVGCIAGAFLSS